MAKSKVINVTVTCGGTTEFMERYRVQFDRRRTVRGVWVMVCPDWAMGHWWRCIGGRYSHTKHINKIVKCARKRLAYRLPRVTRPRN